jgi:mRNA interferase MazF
MNNLKKGDIVLVPFPFTDLSASKLRPAIVLYTNQSNQDITLCFISSQGIATVQNDEFILNITDPEFSKTGLKAVSKVRVTRIVTLERQLITRKLGQITIEQIEQLNKKMIQAFQLT